MQNFLVSGTHGVDSLCECRERQMFSKQLSNYRKVGAEQSSSPLPGIQSESALAARGGLIVYTRINEKAKVRLIKS